MYFDSPLQMTDVRDLLLIFSIATALGIGLYIVALIDAVTRTETVYREMVRILETRKPKPAPTKRPFYL